jgi:hypothetical protein
MRLINGSGKRADRRGSSRSMRAAVERHIGSIFAKLGHNEPPEHAPPSGRRARQPRHRVSGLQLLFMLEQQIVHGPERALPVSGLGTQRCVRVHVGQRQVSPDVSQVAEVGEQRPYDGLGRAAVGALEVAVLHQGHLHIAGPRMWSRKAPVLGHLVMRNQGLADREASIGNRPVNSSCWATSPILVWVSRAARRSLSKAVIASS